MKRNFNLPLAATRIMTLISVVLPAVASAGTRTLSLPSYQVNPGAILEVPLLLDDAGGLAAIRVQVNFNREVLELQAATPGPLGSAFEFSQGDGDGFVQLVFVRAQALGAGTGRLAVLRFRVNAGAVIGQTSELAIADLGLSDSTGVIDLRQKDTLSTTNGQVAVSVRQDIDNAGSGLPDWWEEQHGLGLFTANSQLDPDKDGQSNFLEYAFGGNPLLADSHARGTQAGRVQSNGQTFLSVGFHRRPGDASLHYRVQESADMNHWNDLNVPQRMIGSPEDLQDGTEHVEILGTIPATGAGAGPRAFLRVAVDKQ